MIDIKRYNGNEEFKKTLKLLPSVPTNNEMSEKTGMSKQVATQLSKELLESESKLSPKHKKMFSMFKGEIKVDHHQH